MKTHKLRPSAFKLTLINSSLAKQLEYKSQRNQISTSHIYEPENWLSSCNNKWNTTTSQKRGKIPRSNTRPKANMETTHNCKEDSN